MKTIKGSVVGQGLKIAIVVAKFNSTITNLLLQGALDSLDQCGVNDAQITVVHVPGAFEIPQAANRLAKEGGIDGIICLGAVIRGATPHFDYVCNECAKGITQVSLNTDTPVSFGVLTTDTIDQAMERTGIKHSNKGADAALACLEMISVLKQI